MPHPPTQRRSPDRHYSRRLLLHRTGHQGGAVTEAEALGAEQSRVAGLAVDVLVGPVTGNGRVQGTFAFPTVEAGFVPLLWEHGQGCQRSVY